MVARQVAVSEPTPTRRGLQGLAAGLAVGLSLAFPPAAKATPLGGEVYTDIGVTFEASIHAILGDTGYSLSRISDNADAIWEVFNAEAQVRAIARQAGYASTFGVIATEGPQAGEFQSLVAPRGGTHWQSNDQPWTSLGSLFGAGETFLLAIQTPHRTFTSADSLNVDGLDHMVTWVDDADPYHYFVGFEDSIGGSDTDFNDLVIELQLVIDGPLVPPASGPATTFADATGTRLPVDADTTNGFAIGDVDGVNGPDVVVVNNGQTRLLINDGTSVFTDETGARLPAMAAATMAAAMADVDGDTDLDVILANAFGRNTLLQNNAGVFSAQQIFTDSADSLGVAIADLDGDGDRDAIVANRGSQNHFLLNTGAGPIHDGTAGRLPSDTDPSHGVVLLDANGDGALDLFVANNGAQNRLLTNNGLGVFTDESAGRLPAVDDESLGAAAGDVNGDGVPDIVVAAGSGGAALLLNDGSGVFAAAPLPAIAEFATAVGLRDFDDDGTLDLFVATAGQDRVLFNDGTGTFTDETATALPADTSRSFGLGLGDTDADLDDDVLLANPLGQNRALDNQVPYPRIRLSVAPDYIEQFELVTISIEVFDEDGLGPVTVEVTEPDASITAVPLVAGIAEFTPTLIGNHTVTVRAGDTTGPPPNVGIRTTAFEVFENDVTPPSITLVATPESTPLIVGQSIAVSVSATDDLSGVDTIEVTRTVDEACVGAIAPEIVPLDLAGNATVVTDTTGINRICVRARDLDGNESTDEAAIEVFPDTTPPVVTGLTVTPPTIEITNPVTIEVQATDDVVVSTVIVEITWPSNPGGVSQFLGGDGTGTFSGSLPFTPFLPELYTVTARAFDGAGNEGILDTTFTATGDPDLEPPVVSLSIVPPVIAQGGTTQITVSATDNINVDSLTLTVNDTPVPIPPSGIIDYVAPVIGIYDVVARAEDPTGNFDEETGTFEAIDPATDTTAPTVAITTPSDGDEALGLVDIIGTADDITLQSYTLEWAPAGSSGFTPINTGTLPVIAGLLGTLDTSLLPNGLIDIRLTAVDANSNVGQATRTVSVSGENKPGVFQASFVDLSVPVSGIPISIIRSYDSRTRGTSQDFGHGWKVEVVQSATYTFNRPPGESWSTPLGNLLAGGFCPPGSETAFHIIEIRVSDTEFYQFRPTLDTGVLTTLPVTCLGSMNFTQIGGVPGASLEILDFNQFFYTPGDPDLTYPIDHLTLGGQVFQPRDVRLTTLQGKVLDINLTDGLQRVADANGNSLVINSAGVTHTSGKSVSFVRDGSGRITSITDPRGNSRTYAYDVNGDLISATDRDSNTTQYFYEDAPHFLTRIRDPEGNDTLTNEYDADGRLVAKTDSEGERTEIAYDLLNDAATLTAPNGDEIQLLYDDRGNITQASGGGQSFQATYDARGNLLTRTDPLGHARTYTYDANDNLTSREDHLGNRVEFAYDANGRLLTNTDANGTITEFTYDAGGNLLTRTQDPGGLNLVTAFTYDANGNRLTEVDARGTTTAFTYDADGNLLTRTQDPGGLNLVTTFAYDANGNKVTETNPRGIVTRFTYDNRGNVLTRRQDNDTGAVGELDLLTTFAYDSNGRVISETDPNGNTTATTYDGRGAVTRIDYEDGTFEVFGYDEKGRRTGATDRLLRTTFYGYDRENRLVTVRDPLNGEVTRTYDAAGRTIAEEDPLGRKTTFTYDAADRRTSTTTDADGLAHTTTFTYTPSGRVATETDPLGNTTTYTYDPLDRLVRTDFPTVPPTNTQVEYDALGNRTAEIDQAGNRTEYVYDAVGRLVLVRDPLLAETTYAYDANGNQVSQTDANSNTTTYTYDAVDRRITVQRPLGMSASTTYDANGNVLSQTDFNGDTTAFTYDSNNRMVSRTPPGVAAETFTYDAVGNRLTATDARGATTWTYDLLDRLTQRTDPDTTVVQYEYDAVGNRTALVSPTGRTEYAYDALNRLVTVTAPDTTVTTYTYDAANNLDSIDRPDGTTTTYAHDPLGRLTGISTVDSLAASISTYTCMLDTRGNRTQVIDGHTGRTVDYTYDELSRLTQEQITGADAETITYTYDPVGNRLTKTSTITGATTYTYDNNDSLLTDGGTTYTYDNNGNVVRRQTGGTAVDYTYDGLNRLVQVDDGTTAVDYAYDVDANRVQRIVSGGGTINFLIHANRTFAQVIRETDGGGGQLASYLHGLDLLRQDRGGGTSYYHYDPQTSTRQLTDASGTVTDTYDYDAYGVPRTTTGTTVNDHRYVGENADPIGDLVYLRARWLQPSVGRFLSEDPAAAINHDPRTLNRYVYALNNPVNRIDPSGEFSLAGMMTAVSISKILVTMAPAITTGIATIAIINAFWEPGFELRNAGLLILSSTSNSVLTELAYRMYIGGTALIELGAALIDLTKALIDLTFAFASLASSINSLVNSVNAIQALANTALLINSIVSLAGKVQTLSGSMQNLSNTLGAGSQGASPPPAAQQEAQTIKSVAKEIVVLALNIASKIQ